MSQVKFAVCRVVNADGLQIVGYRDKRAPEYRLRAPLAEGVPCLRASAPSLARVRVALHLQGPRGSGEPGQGRDSARRASLGTRRSSLSVARAMPRASPFG